MNFSSNLEHTASKMEDQSSKNYNLANRKSNINSMELESRKVFAKYWSTDGVFYYCMEINNVSVCRRSIDSFVNGTKLLNAANLTRGRRDGLLKKVTNKFVVRNGIAPLRGVWIPLHVAQDFAGLEDIEDICYPLLEENLEDAFKSNPEFVNAINKKMKNFKDSTESIEGNKPLLSSKTNSISNADDVVQSLKENISTESLMKFVKADHNQLLKPKYLKNPSPINMNMSKTNGSSSVVLSTKLSVNNLYPTPKIADLNSVKFHDEKSSIKSQNDENNFHNETSNSTRVMTPISKIIKNPSYVTASGNTYSSDITGNTNTRTVINTPHGYVPCNVDSLNRKPYEVNPHVYGHLAHANSVRLNNHQPHYMMYQPPGNMFGMSVYNNTFQGEDHFNKMYSSSLQQPQSHQNMNYHVNCMNNNYDDQYHYHQPYIMHNLMNANYQKQMNLQNNNTLNDQPQSEV